MKTRVAQRVGLMLGTLIQVCVADDGTGGVHSIFLVFHQQGKGKRNDKVLGGHEAFPHFVTRRINSSFPYIRTNKQSTSTFTRRLNIRGMLPILGSMRGLSQQAPTWGSHGCGSLLDFLISSCLFFTTSLFFADSIFEIDECVRKYMGPG